MDDPGTADALDASLGNVQFHLRRYDALRAATANRASLLLTASAILLAAVSVFYSLDLRAIFHENVAVLAAVVAALLAVFLLVLSAMWHAMWALVTLRRSSEVFEGFPWRGLYNQTDVVQEFATFEQFHGYITTRDRREEMRAAEAGLWVDIQQHALRYRHLRRGAWHLMLATIPFFGVAAAVLFASTFWP